MENDLEKIAKLIRYYILISTTKAGSGHPSTCLSAVEIMTTLCFDGFYHFNLKDPLDIGNDRLVFSKGHGAPLLYSIYAVAGKLKEKDMLQLRTFNSPLEGHPTMRFAYSEAATGSLGQGLSVGVGMALALRANFQFSITNFQSNSNIQLPKIYVLLGDSEIAEGQVWEAIQIASHYKLDNLVGILDVNRLGQRGETMLGTDVFEYEKRISSFGWDTIVVDGHDLDALHNAYTQAVNNQGKPIMIIAKTIKGKGVSLLEDKDGWHGRVLSDDELEKALTELGEINKDIIGIIEKPESTQIQNSKFKIQNENSKSKIENYKKGDKIATRKAYGQALLNAFDKYPNIVVLDAETSNSTYSEIFKEKHPDKFFEMYIAEQNMVSAAVGFSRLGLIPFASSFSAFLTRSYDQIRMSQYGDANIKIVGSHCGVTIGQDGPSQMGLEDISMFRSILDSVVLYPSDAVSCQKLVFQAAKHKGIVYIRTTRGETPVIYDNDEEFPIGGFKIVHKSDKDEIIIISAGITLHESIKVYKQLKKEGINVQIIDLYCVKPIDAIKLSKEVRKAKAILTVEDHYPAGGIGEAVRSALSAVNLQTSVPIYSLAVLKRPRSASPDELLEYEEISAKAIVRKITNILKEK